MKYSVPTLLILPLAYGWTPQQNRAPSFVGITASKLMVKKVPSEMDMTGEMDLTGEVEMDNGNPCWEDLYDDDCAMSNVAAASFVASEWIKSLPCAEGIEVSFSFDWCIHNAKIVSQNTTSVALHALITYFVFSFSGL